MQKNSGGKKTDFIEKNGHTTFKCFYPGAWYMREFQQRERERESFMSKEGNLPV